MADPFPSVTPDQVAALVELARAGSLRAAAAELNITEQGVRNRLVALEVAASGCRCTTSSAARGGDRR